MSKALMVAVAAAGLLCAQSPRSDILQDFEDSVSAQAAAAAAAGNDLRPIPDHAVKGVMFPPRGRLVPIDDTVMMLAPGSKIRDLGNRIVLPSAITAPVNVRYTVDSYSHVHNIWLMPGEVELKSKEKSSSGNN
ncbi:MAG TPA: hypothetical protein VLS27_17280 [Gammaproteobacteria bacterium]|nr:hypothetical protein [Gammaproteobacteria bacterium]